MAGTWNAAAVELDLDTAVALYNSNTLNLDLLAAGGSALPEYRISGRVQVSGVAAPGLAVSILSLPPNGPLVAADGVSDAQGDYDLYYRLDDAWPAFVMAIDAYGDPWAASLGVAIDELIHPSTPNGFIYRALTAGTLAATEPAWWTDYSGDAAARTVGTAQLKAVQLRRPQVIGPITPELA